MDKNIENCIGCGCYLEETERFFNICVDCRDDASDLETLLEIAMNRAQEPTTRAYIDDKEPHDAWETNPNAELDYQERDI